MSGGAIQAFLQYSLRHGRRIRAVISDGGGMRMLTLTVTDLTGDAFTYVTPRRKTPESAPIAAVLSCDYARGDRGED